MPVRTRRQVVQPFRFLKLPLEMRLLIYDLLPITIKHHTLVDSTASTEFEEEIANPAYKLTPPSISLVIKTVPVALRATCRQVLQESFDAFRRKLKHIRQEPLRLIVDAPSLRHVVGWWQSSLLLHIDEQRADIRQPPSLTKEYKLDLADTGGTACPWDGLRIIPGTRECNRTSEFVHMCATSIEARLPPYRRVAVLVQSHICCWLEIETARKYCRANFWSDSNRDCLNIEYSIPIKTHEKMRQKHLFVPVSHREIEASWAEGVVYV